VRRGVEIEVDLTKTKRVRSRLHVGAKYRR
jgi:hypothetical protein